MSNAWDKAFSNREAVADAGDWLTAWTAASQVFDQAHAGSLTCGRAYGEHEREVYDVVEPEGTAQGTLIFIHGGYWRSLSRYDNHPFAAGPLACGWRVVLIEYPLCPEVSLASLCASVARGLNTVAEQYTGDLVIAGHSAGGHLTALMVSQLSDVNPATRRRIRRAVSISGLHDLRPMTFTTDLNGTLGLDMAQAAALSPALSSPDFSGDLLCVVGAAELPELRRQNTLLANIWTGLGCMTEAHELAGEHHFSILEGLKTSGSALTRWVTLG